jgi:SAM-dependent methyltransferase
MSKDFPPICDYEGSDYQKSFWETGSRAYEDMSEASALRRLLPKGGDLLLEIGAGAGRNTPRYGGFERVVLLDYSLSQLQQAQERLGRDTRYIYIAGDAYRLPFVPGLFEAATMIRALHHMADPVLALQQIQQVLKSGAIFILEFPNKRNLKAILRYALKGQSWNPFSLEPVEFAALNFDFHPKAIRQWLQGMGFIIERQLPVSNFRLGVLKRGLPPSLLVTLDRIVQLSGNWLQFSPSVFLRARNITDSPSASPGTFFRCPDCGHYPLEEKNEALVCPSCSREFVTRGGIYDFRPIKENTN